jgi:hypothetical protein
VLWIVLRVGAVYAALAAAGVPLPGYRFLPYPLRGIYSAFFVVFLLVLAAVQGMGRRPLWRYCAEGLAGGYLVGLCAALATTLSQDQATARISSMFRDGMSASQWLLMPVAVLTWIDGALLGWFTWVSRQERQRQLVYFLASMLVAVLVRLVLPLLGLRLPWVGPP